MSKGGYDLQTIAAKNKDQIIVKETPIAVNNLRKKSQQSD